MYSDRILYNVCINFVPISYILFHAWMVLSSYILSIKYNLWLNVVLIISTLFVLISYMYHTHCNLLLY